VQPVASGEPTSDADASAKEPAVHAVQTRSDVLVLTAL
jgi:hypothetical protein